MLLDTGKPPVSKSELFSSIAYWTRRLWLVIMQRTTSGPESDASTSAGRFLAYSGLKKETEPRQGRRLQRSPSLVFFRSKPVSCQDLLRCKCGHASLARAFLQFEKPNKIDHLTDQRIRRRFQFRLQLCSLIHKYIIRRSSPKAVCLSDAGAPPISQKSSRCVEFPNSTGKATTEVQNILERWQNSQIPKPRAFPSILDQRLDSVP